MAFANTLAYDTATQAPGAMTFGRTTFDRTTVSKILLSIMTLCDKNFKPSGMYCKTFYGRNCCCIIIN